MRQDTPLKRLLADHEVTQAEFATGIDRSEAMVSRMVSGEASASQETIDRTLAYLSKRLGRRVTYEQVFGPSRKAVVA